MRLAMVLGWLLTAGFLQAEAPMDLDSPFLKTALIQDRNGVLAEKVVQRGRFQSSVLELVKEDGGLLVLPTTEVIAVLPQLPSEEVRYLQADAKQALQFLRMAQTQLPDRPEVSASNLSKWQELAENPTKEDQLRTADLAAWLLKCQQASSADFKVEEIENLRIDGVSVLERNPEKADEIKRELESLLELKQMDLGKIESRQAGLGPLGENFFPGTLLWLLLVLPVILGLGCFSGGIQRLRAGAVLAGVLWVLPAVFACVWLFALFVPGIPQKPIVTEANESVAARRVFWLTVNHMEKWVNQSSKKVSLSEDDWLAFLKCRTTDGVEAEAFPFWYLGKPTLGRSTGGINLTQPVCAKKLTLVFNFSFKIPDSGQSWTDLQLVGASVGRVPLGPFIGQFVWHYLESSYQPWKEAFGLSQGVRWTVGEGEKVTVFVPQTELPEAKLVKNTPQAKESISAEELAGVFDQGFGKIYTGKVVSVEGNLVQVFSMKEGLGSGTMLQKEDPMDEFTLEGLPEGAGRRYPIRVRCQFKSSEVYFLDSRGDLYKSAPQAQSPSTDIPILRRLNGVTKVRISGGRVESKASEMRLITLYDCRKVEGFDGKGWVAIWGN